MRSSSSRLLGRWPPPTFIATRALETASTPSSALRGAAGWRSSGSLRAAATVPTMPSTSRRAFASGRMSLVHALRVGVLRRVKPTSAASTARRWRRTAACRPLSRTTIWSTRCGCCGRLSAGPREGRLTTERFGRWRSRGSTASSCRRCRCSCSTRTSSRCLSPQRRSGR